MSWRASGKAKMIDREMNGQVLTAQDKLLLMILSDDFNEEAGVAWRSQPKLAAMCFCTDRGIRISLDRLEKAGLLEVVHGGRFGNEYRLLFVSAEKVLRNTVPQSIEDTGTGVPVDGTSNRNVHSENGDVSIKNHEPTKERENQNLESFEVQKQECPKCGSTEDGHKCPGFLSPKQRAKRAGVQEPRKPFPKRRPFETERPPRYQQPAYQPRQPAPSPGPVEVDDDYPRL